MNRRGFLGLFAAAPLAALLPAPTARATGGVVKATEFDWAEGCLGELGARTVNEVEVVSTVSDSNHLDHTPGKLVKITLQEGSSRQVFSVPREQADEIVEAFWRHVDGR